MSNKQGRTEEKSDSELIGEVLEQASENEVIENEVEESELEEITEAVSAEPDEQVEKVEQVELDEQVEEVSLEQLQKQLKQAEKKAEENWDKALRVQAEMENLKRRTQKDLENAHKYGLEKFAKELLSVIDSLELGIQASTSDNPEVVALKQGS